jgi:hypothetical protein
MSSWRRFGLVMISGLCGLSAAVAHDIETDMGRKVRHVHPADGLTDEERRATEDWLAEQYPDAELVSRPTPAFNCFGLAFDQAQSWLDTLAPEDATELLESILADNGYEKRGRVGRFCCVILYRDAAGNVTHAGLVLEVDGAGRPTVIQSKWGAAGQYRHHPDHSPYGAGWEVWCK